MIKKIFKNKFGKAVFVVASGTFLAQFISAIVSPIITRVYSPEEYGVLTLYASVLSVFAISSLKYEIAIPISRNEKIAINVLLLSILILSGFVIVLTIALYLFGSFILNYFNYGLLNDFIILIPIGVFLSGLYRIFRQWALRVKDFNSISITTFTQSLLGNVLKVILGLFGMGSFGLILGQIIGQSAGLTRLSKPVLSKKKTLFEYIKIRKIIWCIKRYKDFPIYNTSIDFLSTFGKQFPTIFIATFFGSQVVGLYGLAYTIVRLPMRLIGTAIGDVFYAEAASIGRKNPKKLKQLSNKLILRLSLIGIIPIITILLFGPELFQIVFGNLWYEAGIYARIISIMLFTILIFAPVSRVYEVFEKQKLRLLIDIFRTVLVVLVFSASWYFKLGPYLTIFLYSIVISIIHLVIFIVAQKIMNMEIEKVNE